MVGNGGGGMPWPAWARYSVSAMLGGGAVLISVTLAFGDTRRDAAEAKQASSANTASIRSLEAGIAWIRAALITGKSPDTGEPLKWGK